MVKGLYEDAHARRGVMVKIKCATGGNDWRPKTNVGKVVILCVWSFFASPSWLVCNDL